MSELPVIQDALRKAAARLRLGRALRGLWIGLFAGAAAWLVAVILYKLLPLPPEIVEFGWIGVVLGAAAGFVTQGAPRVSLAEAARVIENRQALDQRLSTALELGANPAPARGPWSQLVLADAAAAIRGVDPRRLLPFHLPPTARWIALLLAGVVGLGFVPEYRSAARLQARKDAELVRDAGRKLADLVRRELRERPPEAEPARQALEETAALGERLSQARLSKAHAIEDLANAARRLEEETRQLEKDPVLRKLQQAARSPSNGAPSNPSALQRQLEKMRQSTGGAEPEALDQLARQLEKAQKMAAGMDGSAPDAASQEALSQALSQIAQTAQNLGLNLAGLENALSALENLDFDRVLRDLELAGNDLDKLRDMARKLSEMQQSMAELGRNLAEQLERGQAEAAADTLDQMARQLADPNLTPEQREQLLAEVTKALDPASEYGEVAEMLKAAAEGMRDNDRNEAAKNLADAAKELRKLARQAEELQQLAQTLQALGDAQVALMNGKLWQYGGGMCKGGACKGCAQCKGRGFRPGGKPGMGVGTWADEDGWLYYPEMTELVDNSGIKRPDMDPRDHTDRGEGALSENVLPTKLRGQFTPGAMPAITLKGVSIKGESTVQYQEAVEAAQSQAQSALSQDQVPRAYRNAVKGYFDDLE